MFFSSFLESRVGVEICSVDLTVLMCRPCAVHGYLVALLMSSNNNLIIVSALQACDITGGIYLKVPHMPSLLQYLLVSHLKNASVFFVCQIWDITHFTDEIIQQYQPNSQNTPPLYPCSGFFSLIKSRDHSSSFHLLFMLTTELPASVIGTSLKLATCALCACQVSLWISNSLISYIPMTCFSERQFFDFFSVFCNFSPICSTCE